MASSSSRRHFASDNYSGMCPEVLAALQDSNLLHVPGYGQDPFTDEGRRLIRELFETDCEVFFVFNGTAANSLALASICEPFHSVICHEFSHIETDESGAPGFFSPGTKLVPLKGENGKLSPEMIRQKILERDDVHANKPIAISLTQATELGTVYSTGEVRAISEVARELGLKLHMDGARFANAMASLNCPAKEITWRSGVDVLCLGGTKNGMAVGEAVVFFDRQLARDFERRCKQSGQLSSKMRFLAAQWIGLLKTGAWERNARHSNRMAQLLRARLEEIPQLEILFPTEANSTFVKIPSNVVMKMHEKGWRFYTDVGPGGAARLMCSWDTTEADVNALIDDLSLYLK